MIFDGKIYKISGASDYEDASMFNGLIALFEYDIQVRLEYFLEWSVEGEVNRYVRHPYGTIYNFSRDQALCLMAGLWKRYQNPFFVNKDWVDGSDIWSPANNGHYNRCRKMKANFLQNLWLKAEIIFHAKFTPLEESNQLIAMMMVAGPEYVKLWKDQNPEWRKSISLYWDSWRCEKEFGEFMIQKLEQF